MRVKLTSKKVPDPLEQLSSTFFFLAPHTGLMSCSIFRDWPGGVVHITKEHDITGLKTYFLIIIVNPMCTC